MDSSDVPSNRSALTAKTSQTISRILGAKHESERNGEDEGQYDDYSEYDPPLAQPRPAFVHVAPSHTRALKQHEDDRLSPLQPEISEAVTHSHGNQHTEPPPSKDFLHADPRFDDNRWDSTFLAPLLPVQVSAARPVVA